MYKDLSITREDCSDILNITEISDIDLNLKSLQAITLRKLMPLFRAQSGVFLLRDLHTTYFDINKAYIENESWKSTCLYIDYYNFIDPFLKNTTDILVRRDDDLMPQSKLQNLEYYCDFIKPQGISHLLVIYLRSRNYLLGQIGIHRHDNEPSFDPKDLLIGQLIARFLSLLVMHKLRDEHCADFTMDSDLVRTNLKQVHLTNKEIEIAKLICQGLTNKEICRIQNVSFNTITTHIRNIFDKMKVNNRTMLINKILFK
jgi:DNA-binding CsgD family transcriptional regulator